VAYVRTVGTGSGARAVQIVWSSRRGSRQIEHIGSAHDDGELEALQAAARERLAAGQQSLDLGLDQGGAPVPGGPLTIVGSQAVHLWDALSRAYDTLGFDQVAGADEAFRQLVLARIIEPTSKFDSLRVLAEVGLSGPSYATLRRRLPGYATDEFAAALATACAAHAALGPASLVLYDVSTLYFETDTADEFRKPGFSKERRLEPQVTIGLLTDATGFPLMVSAFEGNRGETTTMLPVLRAFMKAHGLDDVIVVADAGMISAGNQEAIEDEGLSFILGAKIPYLPYLIRQWHEQHPDQEIPDGQVFVQPWPATDKQKIAGRRDKTIFYQYKADRARRTLRGIDEQIAKAEAAVAGKAAVKRNRFVTLTGGDKTVNRDLEAKARALAGIKGYTTNLPDPDAEFVIGAYHQLWRIEKSFRMSKHDLRARPIYHHKRQSIEAHLNVVFAALAVTHHVETCTGWSIKQFVRTARRYRTVQIRAGSQILTAEDPLPDDLRDALAQIC
jgi:hypothetical protein